MKAKKILLTTLLTILALCICAAAFIGTSVYQIMFNMTGSDNTKALLQNSPEAEVPEIQDTLPDDFYMLLLGVDSSENRQSGDEADLYHGSFRSDSIIVAHVNLIDKKISLCSIERDIKTKLEGHDGYNKINAAYAFGGVDLMKSEAEKLVGEEIPYYAVVDMDGLVDMIDSVGGIDVDVEEAFFDKMLNDGIETAGMQHLNGRQAIVYARSRYAWAEGDFARARHQREVLNALATKAMSNADLVALYNMAQTVSQNVATNISLAQIFEIGTKLRGMDTATSMYSLMTPTIGEYTNGVSYQVMDDAKWEEVLADFKELKDPNASEEAEGDETAEQTGNGETKSNMKAAQQAIAEGKVKSNTNSGE